MKSELTEYAVRAGPGVSVGGLSLFNLPLQEWVYIMTILYTVIQIGWFAWSRYKDWKKANGG